MPKLVTATIAIVLLALPAAGAAKSDLEPRLQAHLACASITPDEARLRCYDQSVVALQQALTRGSVVLKEQKGPRAREGIVKASGKSGEKRFWVTLDNGDRWTTITQPDRPNAPAVGTRIKVRRTPLGNFWISGPGWRESEAAFAGHES